MSKSNFLLIVLGGVIVCLMVIAAFNVRKIQQSNNTAPVKNMVAIPSVVPTVAVPKGTMKDIFETKGIVDWQVFLHDKYAVGYPLDWQVFPMNSMSDSLRTTEAVNFRAKTDEIPAESGFTIYWVNNPQKLSYSAFLKQDTSKQVGLVSVSGAKISAWEVNGYHWEKIEGDSVGYVPIGNVRYAININNKLFYVVQFNNTSEVADVMNKAIKTMKFQVGGS